MIVLSIVAAVAMSERAQTSFGPLWNEVRGAISSSYYARESKGASMKRLLDECEPQAKAARSPAEFASIVNAMIDKFGDSHFAYYTKSDQGWYMMDGLMHPDGGAKMPEFGAWFKKTPTGYQVSMVLEGTPAQREDVRKGDVIQTVDGAPFSPIDSIDADVDKTVTLGVLRKGQTLTKQVKILSKPAMGMFLEASEDSAKIVEDHGRLIGYFHLWTMASDQFRNALSGAVYGKLKNTDGIILDIRDGFGGRPEGFGDPFFRPDADLKWVTSGASTSQLFGYGRPMVTIINEGSRSAKELFSYLLKKSHRSKLLGHTTAGNVLGTFPRRLSDGSIIEIPIADVFADGSRLEGKGVNPDIPVSPEFDPEGRDQMLSRALDELKNIPSSGRMGIATAQNNVTRKWATANL
jgi:carboxyl-terminal processing protease